MPPEDPARSFQSVLFDKAPMVAPDEQAPPPPYFGDLHLDDIVTAVLPTREASETARVFYEPLRDVATITYRHDVFRDLEDPGLLDAVRAFGEQMTTVQRWVMHASKASYVTDRDRWLLRAAEGFAAAVGDLNERLTATQPKSTALSALRDYLVRYTATQDYMGLVADTKRVKAAIAGVRYRIRIHDAKVTVTRFREEPDFSTEVLKTFEKFRQHGAGKHYEWRFEQDSDMNHVEAAILERVARLHPEPFAALHRYATRHEGFMDPTIARFDREVRFYLAWLDFVERIRRGTRLPFCYPEVNANSREVEACGTFDLALAASVLKEQGQIVPNDVELQGGERIVLVSGPNQGGKTTFARAIGQLHHLASIGVPVPGIRVRLPLVDAIFSHFERTERVEDLSSKLEQDLQRIHAILERATPQSLMVMNESFTSTTVDDQLFIGRRILRKILDRGLLCVIVTFLDELAAVDPAIVSMVSTVDPEDFARRTFEIVRRDPDGLAYTLALAEKHHLTYSQLRARLSA